MVFIRKKNNSRAGRDVRGIEGQLASLAIQTACDDVHQATDLVEASSKEQFGNVIGQPVSKRFAERIYEGIVESHDNASEVFKVVYTNGHSEEMRWQDLMKYLVPHQQPVHPYPRPNKNNETGKALAQIAPAPTRERGRTMERASRARRKKQEVADDIWTPEQARKTGRPPSTKNNETSEKMKLQLSTKNDETSKMMELQLSTKNDETSKMMELRHSSRNYETSGVMNLRRSSRKNETPRKVELRRSDRKRKQVVYYFEETTDEDEDEYSKPNYPLPPIIQVPWADRDEDGVATRRRAPRGCMTDEEATRNWPSLRICAADCPPDESDQEQKDEGPSKQ